MKISVVVVEYHSLDEVSCCIKAFKESIPTVEIIISSNSQYTTEQRQQIISAIPDCKWCFNKRNGGFAYAMNEGLKIATGDYLIISNPDCIIENGIENMARFLSRHPEIGAIAPRITDKFGNLQDSCREYITLPRFMARQFQRIFRKEEVVLNKGFDYNKIQTVDWVIGAFIMVPRHIYEKTGGLSLDYFMYVEDADWCTRIRKCGYEIAYYPKVTVIYKGSRKARYSLKYAAIFFKSLIVYWLRFGAFNISPHKIEKTFNEL